MGYISVDNVSKEFLVVLSALESDSENTFVLILRGAILLAGPIGDASVEREREVKNTEKRWLGKMIIFICF